MPGAQPISSSSGANWLSTMSRIMSGSTRKYSWTRTLRRPAIEGPGYTPDCEQPRKGLDPLMTKIDALVAPLTKSDEAA
ncbi:hypothetical protein MF406_05050 [Georgenia sp. TF02-10]|nr:hypothetical protein [Georgenia sp. TF02-10]UNX55628.1 hypothetical protein MF406_05050 [Georgenia sp. TF02-10]